MLNAFKGGDRAARMIGVIAIILGLTGGAYAATYRITNIKQIKPKVVKQLKGKRGPIGLTGPAGAAGPAGAKGDAGPAGAKGDSGAAGAKGDSGAAGANGAAGSNGDSVASTPEAPGPNCTNGGVKLTTGDQSEYACNGSDGSDGAQGDTGDPWTAGGTLPVGSTETGTFDAATMSHPEILSSSISFPIKLAAALDAANVHYSTDAGFGDDCTGTAENPTAPSGHLCMYQGIAVNMEYSSVVGGAFTGNAADRAGAVLSFNTTAGGPPSIVTGTWAVTG